MFKKRRKAAGQIHVTPKGHAYFTRKHIEEQVDKLGLFEGCERLRKYFDSDRVTDIVMAADMKDLVPVVALLPFREAHEVFEGRALLAKLDVDGDDAGDDAEDDA